MLTKLTSFNSWQPLVSFGRARCHAFLHISSPSVRFRRCRHRVYAFRQRRVMPTLSSVVAALSGAWVPSAIYTGARHVFCTLVIIRIFTGGRAVDGMSYYGFNMDITVVYLFVHCCLSLPYYLAHVCSVSSVRTS